MQEFHTILDQEESYWRQQARCKWLVQGERNTKYFHACVSSRRRRNRIEQLKDSSGAWCTDGPVLKQLANDFYQTLYQRDCSVTPCPHNWSFSSLGHSSLWWLNRGVTDYEIKMATFQLGASKAPEPDGLPAGFFQKYWATVGVSITSFVQEVFRSGQVPEQANQSIICLLPKQESLEDISQFRPICLTNVIIKIISKVIADRVKRVIGDLTGEW